MSGVWINPTYEEFVDKPGGAREKAWRDGKAHELQHNNPDATMEQWIKELHLREDEIPDFEAWWNRHDKSD